MNGLTFSLSQFPVLAGVNDQARQAIAACAHKRTYRPGQMIALAGAPTRSVYMLVGGRVRSQRSSTEGREVVLQDLGPGECFDLASVLDGMRNLATVSAVSNVTLYAMPAIEFRRIVQEQPALSLALLSHLSRRVRHLSDTAEGLALYDVRIRLARRLLAYATGAQEHASVQESARVRESARVQESTRSPRSGWPCPRYLTQGELAAQVGTVRDVVGRTLRSFGREGLVRRERGRLVITDLAGLQRLAMHGSHALAS